MIPWLSSHRRHLAWIIGSIAVVALFLSCAKSLWKHNPLFDEDSSKSYDQTFYLTSAKDLATGAPGIMPRSRMPLYPWLLHFFYDSKRTDADQLNVYIRVNVTLSVVCSAAVFFMLLRSLGPWPAVLVTLVTMFRVFVYKAVLVQPEVLFYTFYFGLFLVILRLLQRSSARLFLAAGVLAGVTHLTKGSALPMLGIFLGCAFLREFIHWWRERGNMTPSSAVLVLRPMLFIVGFLLVTGVYLRNSQRTYGSPFYDPNTRYYFWAGSPREMAALQHLGLANWKPRFDIRDLDDPLVEQYLPKWCPDAALRKEIVGRARREGSVTLEERYDILPSSAHWLATHTWRDALWRLWAGLLGGDAVEDTPEGGPKRTHKRDDNPAKKLLFIPSVGDGESMIGHNRDHPNGYWDHLRYVFGASLATLVLALAFSRAHLWAAMRPHLLLVTFAVATILLTGLAFAWWGQVSIRNRYFLGLYLPLMFSFMQCVRLCCSVLPIQLTLIWHRRTVFLNAWALFLLSFTVFVATDLNDPLNRGNLRNPKELWRHVVQ